jgi:hypothetical protein
VATKFWIPLLITAGRGISESNLRISQVASSVDDDVDNIDSEWLPANT